MKNSIILCAVAAISLAAASTSEARFKRPSPVAKPPQTVATPEEIMCGEIAKCLFADSCYIEDENGNLREVTTEEKDNMKKWMDENCTYVAAPEADGGTCSAPDAAVPGVSHLQVGG